LIKGLDKLILNEEKILADLDNNWAVVAEAIQTILRREGFPKPYETLKELTRTNMHIDHKAISAFIETLNVSAKVKAELNKITPANYTGRFEI
jgi:adenylosuccinate lyase